VSFLEKFLERVVRITTKDETYSPLRSVGLNIPEPLLKEVVMPEVCIGIVRNYGEEDNDRKAKEVGSVDRCVEGGVVMDADGTLHPINDTLAVRAGRSVPTNVDAGIVGELSKRSGD